MDLFNQANIDEICGHCVEFIDEIGDSSSDTSDDDDNSKNYFSIIFLIYQIAGERVFIDIFFAICEEFFSETYCSDAVNGLVTDMFLAINEPHVNSTWACQRLAFCPYLINTDTLNPYVDDVLQDKPAEVNNTEAPANRSTYQVLHMTDIHIDFKYQEVIETLN